MTLSWTVHCYYVHVCYVQVTFEVGCFVQCSVHPRWQFILVQSVQPSWLPWTNCLSTLGSVNLAWQLAWTNSPSTLVWNTFLGITWSNCLSTLHTGIHNQIVDKTKCGQNITHAADKLNIGQNIRFHVSLVRNKHGHNNSAPNSHQILTKFKSSKGGISFKTIREEVWKKLDAEYLVLLKPEADSLV